MDTYGGHDLFSEINNILTHKSGCYCTIVGDYPGSGFGFCTFVSSISKASWRQILSKMGLLSFKYKFFNVFGGYGNSFQKAKDQIESGDFKIFII